MQRMLVWGGAIALAAALFVPGISRRGDPAAADAGIEISASDWSTGDVIEARSSAFAGGGASLWVDGRHLRGVYFVGHDRLRFEVEASLPAGPHELRALLPNGVSMGPLAINKVGGGLNLRPHVEVRPSPDGSSDAPP